MYVVLHIFDIRVQVPDMSLPTLEDLFIARQGELKGNYKGKQLTSSPPNNPNMNHDKSLPRTANRNSRYDSVCLFNYLFIYNISI
jgi:hypothetical protein